jgi:carboxyl-terminal processing protease
VKPKGSGLVTTLLVFLALVCGLVAGNLASGLDIFDLATALGWRYSAPPVSGSNWGHNEDDPSDPVYASVFASRMGEVCKIFDEEALHVFTEAEIDQATATAIEGLIEASGDIRAEYYNALEYEVYKADSSGEYVGIGITLQAGLDGRPTVTRVFPDSPAQEAGVQAGDVIVAIDGEYKDWQVNEAVSTIRREQGLEVTVVWERDGSERPTTMNVRTIKRPIVTSELIEYQGHKVGYICLEQFTYGCSTEVRSALRDLDAAGAECYILDLRDNPGGLLYQAIDVASLFIRDGVVVQIEERSGTTVESTSNNYQTDKPLVVMVNGGSASASELVAAAFQDHKRATVVGEQSYGKGTVQNIHELSFGGAIKYTIAHYLSPDGRPVEGVGITPDFIIDDGNRINDADLIHKLENGEDIDFEAEGIDPNVRYYSPQPVAPGEAGYVYQKGSDVQLDKALEILISGN